MEQKERVEILTKLWYLKGKAAKKRGEEVPLSPVRIPWYRRFVNFLRGKNG